MIKGNGMNESTPPKLHRQIVEVLVSEFEQGAPPHQIDGISRDLLACAWGLYAQINRLGRAFLLLTDSDMGHETNILIRVVLEHTILLHWVAELGDRGVAAILASQSKRVDQTIKTAREAQMALSRDVERQMRAAAETPISETKAIGQFRTVCKELGLLELYFVYSVESGFVHPSIATINTYIDADGNLATRPQRKTHETNVEMLAYCLIWANRDFDMLTPGQPRTRELENLARSVQAAPVLPPYRPAPPPPQRPKRGRGGRRRRLLPCKMYVLPTNGYSWSLATAPAVLVGSWPKRIEWINDNEWLSRWSMGATSTI
jgi:Family of unknown function (DUF5677)